jgi:hypothetical protein
MRSLNPGEGTKLFVDYDREQPPGRNHPWTFAVANPEEKYVDFKAHLDHIPLVLPDFRRWSHYPAIQRFYSLLTWLNGAESIFESTDCGLRPPRQDTVPPAPIKYAFEGEPIVMHARLTIIFRNLTWNTSVATVDRLKTAIHDVLRDNVPNIPAVVKIGEWAHFFTEISKEGRAITLLCWAWGQDEAMSMAQLSTTFDVVHGCLRWISDGTRSRA